VAAPLEPPGAPSAPNPDGPPRWPPWYGFLGLLAALVVAIVLSGLLYGALKAAGVDFDADAPGLNVVATVIQDVALVACAIWLAARITRPRPWHFGLRPTPLGRAAAWAALALAIYLVFQVIYVAAVDPHEEQTTLRDLGAGEGALATLAIGVLVVGVAPIAEEFFFRGFFYGALRSRFSFLPAAVIDGLVFGAIHAPTGIEAVPPLIVLGIAFCMCYEATGSIYPCIVLHALNNMLAFGVDEDGSWGVGTAVASTVIVGCVAAAARTRRPATA
jgi:membrane protease YdiL (CAAX protease family)